MISTINKNGVDMRVFLDLDGVIRDYSKGTIKKFDLKCTVEDITEYHMLIKFYCERISGKKWDEIPEDDQKELTKTFWEENDAHHFECLGMTPWAEDLLWNIEDWKPFILTSPTWTSAGGTQRWIRKYLPNYFMERRYMIGSCKYICGFSDYLNRVFSVLIDDAPEKVEEFKNAGGEAILFPAPYNENRDLVDFRVDYVVDQLRQLERKYEKQELFDI